MPAADDLCAIYVDMGTTNTRVWLARGDEPAFRAEAHAGVRDAAREESRARIVATLRELIARVRAEAERARFPHAPSCVAAAGMITSADGLVEVPHVAAPAGLAELAAAARLHNFPEVVELPVLLVPGVRTGPAAPGRARVGEVDVIRGEETLCAGLNARGVLPPGATLLNLGSHWKAIGLGEGGRIASSFTRLSGELL